MVAVAFTAQACRSVPPPAQPARDVVLITIDTLRADFVGVYGSQAARTPTLDGLARDGARFERAWAPAPMTLPSHASLLSARYPPGHGARHNGMAVPDSVPTLATAFKAAGFDTAAFVSAFPLDRRFGLARGFDVYDDELPRTPEGKALKFVHRGSYENMDNTYEAITNHLDDKKLEAKDTFIEEYITDPLKTQDDKLVINVYVPLK